MTPQEQAEIVLSHYRLQQGIFFKEQSRFENGVAAFSTVTPIPMWNHSAWIGGNGTDFECFLEASSRYLNSKQRRPVVYLSDPSIDETKHLKAQGFEKFDEEAWMILADFPGAPELGEAQIIAAYGTKNLEAFIGVFTEAYQTRERGYSDLFRLEAPLSGKSQTHYLLLRENTPVCIGTLISDGQHACLYNVGTHPKHRKKGYGAIMVRHMAAEAVRAGCETVYLQVENKSNAQHLYERLGFETQFLREGFRLKNWQPGSPARTQLSNLLGFRGEGALAQGQCREAKPVEAEISRKLNRTCDALGIKPSRLAAAAWAFVLHRYTGEEDIHFGFIESPKTSTAELRVQIEPKRTAIDWLKQLSATADLASNEDVTFETMFRWRETRSSTNWEASEYPLEITFWKEAPSGVEIQYRSDLFSKEIIHRLSRHFLTALEELLTRPQARLEELNILTHEEKHQLLVEWNQSSFTPSEVMLKQLFESQVEQTPDSPALVFARAGNRGISEELTYRQVNRKANRLAHRLQKLGVGPERFVGVCMDRSLDMVVSLLAILKAGGACVPLDPAYPAERLEYMIEDTKAPVILTQSHLVDSLKLNARSRVISLDKEWRSLSEESEKNPRSESRPGNSAYVIYTSGSTGQPKGVVIPHSSISNHVLDCRKHYGLSSKDRVLQFSSFNFDASFEQILPALMSGACLVVRDNEIWSTSEFARKLEELQLTVADIPTAYWHELAETWSKHPETIPPHSLRLIVVGGEALIPEKLTLWQQTPMNQVRLINAYGPTEATITATSYEIPQRKNGSGTSGVIPIGRPRGFRKAYVLDKYGVPTPIGVPGELHIGGMLARGYHNRPELTESRFIPNPFSDEADARLYRTGDLVRYLPDGNLEFLGRIDDQVKIRGFRIELGEIETALSKHPLVREALVVARADQSGAKRLIAYVIAPGPKPVHHELRGHLQSKLPDYMIPSSFLVLEQWPLMPNGKIDRRALPEPEDAPNDAGDVSGPKDPLELQIQLLFERVLKRGPINVTTSFFELGGDSLQALELLVEIEKATGKNLPLGTLYQSSTVEELAREVQSRTEGDEWSSLVPLQTGGRKPPLYLLHTTPGDILGYGNLVYRLSDDQPCYGFQSIGLKECRLSHSSVEEMAAYYVDLLRKFQPHGPYHLGGWCYGGIVAVEMARMLKEVGEEVGLLALLETVAMPPDFKNYLYYLHRLQCVARMSPGRWVTYVREKIRYARQSRIANRMRFRGVDGQSIGEIIDPRLAKLEHVYNANLKALRTYKTHYYDGKVTLFNAAERDTAVIPDPYYGWVGLAKEVEIHEVPGNHDTMLTEPNVAVLASRLNECLVKAQNT